MKTKFLIVLFSVFISFSSFSQAIMNDNSGMIYLNKNEVSENNLEGKRGAYYGSHYLGEEIQMKYDRFLKLYVGYESTGGAYATEKKVIAKREIYDSVKDLDKFFKKAIRKDEISSEDAKERFGHVLDVANSIRFYDTNQFQLMLSTAKSEKQIEKYYKSIKFEE